MIVRVINESISNLDRYTNRIIDIYENATKYLPVLEMPNEVEELRSLRNNPILFRRNLIPRIQGLKDLACFSYASLVAAVFYCAGDKGKIYIGLASKSSKDRDNVDKLIGSNFVNHCWYESESGKIYETSLEVPHLYSLRELTPGVRRTLIVKDKISIYREVSLWKFLG